APAAGPSTTPWRVRKAARSTPQSRRRSSRQRVASSRKGFCTGLCCAEGPAASSHHLEEGRLELIHLVLGAHRDPDMSRPARPNAADKDLLLLHRRDDFAARTLHIHHETIRDRWNVRELILFQEAEHVAAHIADQLATLRNQRLV